MNCDGGAVAMDERSGSHQWIGNVALVVGVAVCGLFVWEAIVWLFDLPRALLPTPRQVAAAAIREREPLLRATLMTGCAAAAGLVAAISIGTLISVAFSQSRRIRLAFFPYVVFLQTVPIVAIAPLLIIWSGYRFRTVVIVTVIVCSVSNRQQCHRGFVGD